MPPAEERLTVPRLIVETAAVALTTDAPELSVVVVKTCAFAFVMRVFVNEPPASTREVAASEPAVPPLPRLSVAPGPTVTAPVKVLAPVSATVPAPLTARPSAEPPSEMTPPTVSVLARAVMVGVAVRRTAPAPRFKAFEPI